MARPQSARTSGGCHYLTAERCIGILRRGDAESISGVAFFSRWVDALAAVFAQAAPNSGRRDEGTAACGGPNI